MNINLITRMRNKYFILSVVSAIVLIAQNLGYNDLIPKNYETIVNTILSILTMLGIIIDPTTPNISDQTTEKIEQ